MNVSEFDQQVDMVISRLLAGRGRAPSVSEMKRLYRRACEIVRQFNREYRERAARGES